MTTNSQDLTTTTPNVVGDQAPVVAKTAVPATASSNVIQPTLTSAELNTTISSSVVDAVLNSSQGPSVTVVLSAPKTTEQLVTERALKRIARKNDIREKAEGHRKAGDILFESKNYKAAYPQYLEAIRLWGTNPSYFIALAGAYRKLTWYEEAAHAATRALTLEPKNAEARYTRGVARLEQRLLKPAKIDFETVLEHDPSHLLARAALTEVTHFIATSTHLGTHDLGPDPVEEMVKDVDFGFPHYDYEPLLEVVELSDSEDCNHLGNGVQCRFYNHEGCARGSNCIFSHAPDEKSVRDDLGKNVCIYFLLDSCKFGASKCIYSHTKDALPKRGWWTNPEQIAKVKSVLEVAEQKNREQRQLENERWKAYIKALKASGKPPKSAGIKKEKGDKTEKKEKPAPVLVSAFEGGAKDAEGTGLPATPVTAGTVPPKSAGQKKRGGKPPNSARRLTASKKKGAAAPITPATTASGKNVEPVPVASEQSTTTKSPESTTNNDSATVSTQPPAHGFTDYQLNVPSASTEIAATDSVILNY